jgi:hypothetical protein
MDFTLVVSNVNYLGNLMVKQDPCCSCDKTSTLPP